MKALMIGGSGGLSGALAAMAMETYEVWALTRGKRLLGEGIIPLCADRDNEHEFQNAVLSSGITWDVVFDCICMNEHHAAQDLDVLSQGTGRLVIVSTDSVYDPARKATLQTEEGFFAETGRSLRLHSLASDGIYLTQPVRRRLKNPAEISWIFINDTVRFCFSKKRLSGKFTIPNSLFFNQSPLSVTIPPIKTPQIG